MTRRILAGGMLRTAEKLAGYEAGPGRPPLSDLRRATSTAYYALFHQILRHGAIDFLTEATEEEIADISRWYTHKGVHDAADLVLLAASDRPTALVKREKRQGVMAIRAANGGVVPDELVQLADAFQDLQAARHSADYDGNYDPARAVTLAHVEAAQQGLEAAWQLWRFGQQTRNAARRDKHTSYLIFLRLALLISGGPKAR